MVNNRGCRFTALCLALVLLLCGASALAREAVPFAPPPWSVGDWWVVDCQVYNSGTISPSKPGWTARQSWRFQVEEVGAVEGQPHYVVSIDPGEGNSCPYRFRFWFEAATRRVSRYELHHPAPTAAKPRRIAPQVVEHDLSGSDPAPFFTTEFPALPLAVPLFDVDQEDSAFPAGGMAFDTHQVVETVEASAAASSADPRMREKVGATAPDGNRLVTIATPSDVVERQFWNEQLPWCTYGERMDKGQALRRYWLVETGK